MEIVNRPGEVGEPIRRGI